MRLKWMVPVALTLVLLLTAVTPVCAEGGGDAPGPTVNGYTTQVSE